MSPRSGVPLRSFLRRRRLFAALGLLVVLPPVGCAVSTLAPRPLPTRPDSLPSTLIRAPIRAHLVDGRTIVFREGTMVRGRRLTGAGQLYALLDDGNPTPVQSVSLDSVVGVEAFERRTLVAPTVLASTAVTALGVVAAAGLAIAIFGSCPTVYADTGAGPVLQAEGFSYAIAPLLEHRDLDRLAVKPGSDGVIRLELRNEALETHLLNHVELLAVRHAAGSSVVPDQRGHVVALGALRAPQSARDRAGRDVLERLHAVDGRVYETAPEVLARAGVGDLDDWIDLEVDGLPAGDSLAVVLRLRNSLLNTVLLYDGILGGRDAADWLTAGMSSISNAIDVSRWYVATMGMRASARSGEPGTDTAAVVNARLSDVGPIAFRDVAIVLPRPVRDAKRVRVRLRFVADNWRIDRAAVAGTLARPVGEPLPLARVVVPTPSVGKGPLLDTAAVRMLSAPDELYLETRPGQRMTLEFAPPRAHAGDERTTYLIAWQGWYREWLRGAWLAAPRRTTPWTPGDAAVAEALERWRAKRDTLEHQFYSSSIPVQ